MGLVVAVLSLRTELSMLLSSLGPLLLNGDEKGLPSRKPQLLEVTSGQDQSDVIAVVDHLDL